ncbi:hypothetical protein BVX97_03835 [bacterium E08(2017)]|nr:hypothetical protein BVX97_03835 [bacterium E08(2017)]
MFSTLLFLFITIPILEIVVLFRVYNSIGGMETVALVILTGFLGAALARAQGLMTVMAIQEDLRLGRVPAPRVMDGVMILVAGVLLITPGLLTDMCGFLLLIPVVRGEIRMWLKRKVEKAITEGQVVYWGPGAGRPSDVDVDSMEE